MFQRVLSLFSGGASALYLWLFGAVIVASLALGLKHYHTAYIEATGEIAVLQSKNDELVLKIKADAVALQKLAADTDARAAAAQVAIDKAIVKARDAEKRAQEILLLPPPTDNACTSADSIFNSYLQGEKK